MEVRCLRSCYSGGGSVGGLWLTRTSRKDEGFGGKGSTDGKSTVADVFLPLQLTCKGLLRSVGYPYLGYEGKDERDRGVDHVMQQSSKLKS